MPEFPLRLEHRVGGLHVVGGARHELQVLAHVETSDAQRLVQTFAWECQCSGFPSQSPQDRRVLRQARQDQLLHLRHVQASIWIRLQASLTHVALAPAQQTVAPHDVYRQIGLELALLRPQSWPHAREHKVHDHAEGEDVRGCRRHRRSSPRAQQRGRPLSDLLGREPPPTAGDGARAMDEQRRQPWAQQLGARSHHQGLH
mmetsp:Transcript_81992/g.265635  ORF Transcript_81992/g.265635 Transcript_81992/m.265635 type:complete len:201 (-) Transcript_81992:1885-2487(-)